MILCECERVKGVMRKIRTNHEWQGKDKGIEVL